MHFWSLWMHFWSLTFLLFNLIEISAVDSLIAIRAIDGANKSLLFDLLVHTEIPRTLAGCRHGQTRGCPRFEVLLSQFPFPYPLVLILALCVGPVGLAGCLGTVEVCEANNLEGISRQTASGHVRFFVVLMIVARGTKRTTNCFLKHSEWIRRSFVARWGTINCLTCR